MASLDYSDEFGPGNTGIQMPMLDDTIFLGLSQEYLPMKKMNIIEYLYVLKGDKKLSVPREPRMNLATRHQPSIRLT